VKSDVDRLMRKAKLDALLIKGDTSHNPSMVYFTGIAHVSGAYLIKARDQDPILFHYPMEREEAQSTGLGTRDLTAYDIPGLIEEAGGDTRQAEAELLKNIFQEYGLSGRISLYGQAEIGPSFGSLSLLEKSLPEVQLVGEEAHQSVLIRARATKDEGEVAHIRKMGGITAAVVGEVATFLAAHRAKRGILVNAHGDPLTIGEVKRRINLWLTMRGAENPKGTIFATGRDSGIPHSAGRDEDYLELGKPIVFDIYPCESGGGYFHDCTRTWCLGYAPDPVLELYEHVRAVYDEVYASLEAGKPCRDFQLLTAEKFSDKGHPTVVEDAKTQRGYVHSLGHGLGLAVHEGPSFSHLESNRDLLQSGAVITVEPGLYYPERDMGVRIEDTVWVRPDGQLESLTSFPKDLVIQVPED
jgi:Xaa-Pro aminopeptidase